MPTIFRRIGFYLFLSLLFSAARAQTNASYSISPNDLYAGIEVGSKGVKLSVIQMGKNASLNGNFEAIKDTAINTDFIDFTPTAFNATLNGLADLYNTARYAFRIPDEKIFTVVSSGVKSQAEKENRTGDIAQLADSFRLIIRKPGKPVPVIDVTEEARLSHLGIVPASRRYNTFLIDIGSGNTKGGYFRNGNTRELKLFTLSWGTKTVTNATTQRTQEDSSLSNFRRQLQRVMNGDPDNEIVYAVNASDAYNMNDNFAFSGGIAWSVATLLYPELIENSVVPLDYDDLVKFNDRLYNDYASFSPKRLAPGVADKSIDHDRILSEAALVESVFDQRALMAGTALLLKIVRQFDGTQDKKHFYLVKNGQVGWISAYVNAAVQH